MPASHALTRAARPARYRVRMHPQPAPTSVRRASRAAIVVLVLAGLWMMHGISAAGSAGCHTAAMSLVSARSGDQDAMAAAAPVETSATRAGAQTGPGAGAAARPAGMGTGLSGDLCLSAQPTDPGTALIALIAVLALTGCVLLGAALSAGMRATTQRRRRWRAPPGRSGTLLLALVCVSRT